MKPTARFPHLLPLLALYFAIWAAVPQVQAAPAAPVITSLGGAASIEIKSNPLDTLVTTITAEDPDSASLTFTLSGPDASLFTVITTWPMTAELSFLTQPDPLVHQDDDGNHIYEVTVTVSDGSLTDTQALSILVPPGKLDPEAPEVTLSSPGETVGSTFVIAGTVADLFGLRSLKVTFNNNEVPLTVPLTFPLFDAESGISIKFATGRLNSVNGANLIAVEAMDLNGQVTTVHKLVNRFNPDVARWAGRYETLLKPPTGITPSVDKFGLVTMSVNGKGAFSGRVRIGGVVVPISGELGDDGAARFSANARRTVLRLQVLDGDQLVDLGLLSLKVTGSSLSGRLTQSDDDELDNAGDFDVAVGTAQKCPFSSDRPVPRALLNQSQILFGKPFRVGMYNIAFLAKVQPGSPPPHPLGDGYTLFRIGRNGNFTALGYLADGTPYTTTGNLRRDLSFALFKQLYGDGGAFGGDLKVANSADTDIRGDDLLWIRPKITNAAGYRDGWPDGILVDGAGTKYGASSVNFGQGPADVDKGNANVQFDQGGLPALLEYPVSISPSSGRVARIEPWEENYLLVFNRATGVYSGSFLHSDGTRCTVRGVILKKGLNRGVFGYFLSNSTTGGSLGGGFSIDPDGPSWDSPRLPMTP